MQNNNAPFLDYTMPSLRLKNFYKTVIVDTYNLQCFKVIELTLMKEPSYAYYDISEYWYNITSRHSINNFFTV